MGNIEKIIATLGVAGAAGGIGVGTDSISPDQIIQQLGGLEDSFKALLRMVEPYIDDLNKAIGDIKKS